MTQSKNDQREERPANKKKWLPPQLLQLGRVEDVTQQGFKQFKPHMEEGFPETGDEGTNS